MDQLPLYISNNFIEWGMKNGEEITPLKLQKLLYLYYARYCYLIGKRPFEDCFVRWKHGPVVESIYHTTKHFGARPLTPLHNSEGSIIKMAPAAEPFCSVFQDVVQQFGKTPARELVELTHGAGKPNYKTAWEKAQDNSRLDTLDIKKDGEVLFEKR